MKQETAAAGSPNFTETATSRGQMAMAEDKSTTGNEAFPIGEFNVGLVGRTTAIYPFSINEPISFLTALETPARVAGVHND